MYTKDETKTKAQLIDELAVVRQSLAQMHQRLIELEAKVAITKVATIQTKSVCADYDTKNLLKESLFFVEPDFSLRATIALKTSPDTPQSFQFPEHPQLRKIFTFIEANYHNSIGLNEIAQEFGYTPSYLTSLVRRLTGQTVYQWIVQRRMFQARALLIETDLAIYQIAEAVGYVDTGHFVKHFRQIHNNPPQTWRELQNRHQ